MTQRTTQVFTRQRSAWRGVSALLVCISLLPGTGHPVAAQAEKNPVAEETAHPFEPTVTPEEQDRINAALAAAETSMTQAVEILKRGGLEDASAALDLTLGNLYFRQDKLDAAAAAYRAALAKMPRFRRAIDNLGRIYLLQGKPRKTIELYRQLVTSGHADADILLLLGHALFQQDRPRSAEAAYRQVFLLDPANTDAVRGLAKALLRQKRFREGLALVDELLQEAPVDEQLWSLRVNVLLADKGNDEAARAIEQARRLGCASPDMLATLGDLYLHRDQPREAVRAYEDAFRDTDPSMPRMLRATRGFLMLGDEERAERMLQKVEAAQQAAAAPAPATKAALLRLKVRLAQQRGRRDTAMALCKQILQLDPVDGETLLLLAELQQRKGQLQKAVMSCERAARIDGFAADARVRQAQIDVERGNYARAVRLLEDAQSRKPRPHVDRYLEQIRNMTE